MKKEQGFILPIIIVVLVIAVLGTAGYFAYKQYSAPKPVACTQEAKLCPDGSSVGRTGPNCEFAQCPDQTASWKTYTNEKYGFEFKLPDSFTGSAINDEPYLFSFRTEGWPYLTLLVTTAKRYGPYTNVAEIFVGGVKSYKGEHSPDCYKGCVDYMPVYIPLDNEKSLNFGFQKTRGTTIEEVAISQNEQSLIDQILSTFKFTPVK